jgi:hypothetical protein
VKGGVSDGEISYFHPGDADRKKTMEEDAA